MQTVTLTQGLFKYEFEQGEPLTVMGITLSAKAELPPVTVNRAEPGAVPDMALIMVVPEATEVAIPWEPVVLLTLATSGRDEFQVTDVVIF